MVSGGELEINEKESNVTTTDEGKVMILFFGSFSSSKCRILNEKLKRFLHDCKKKADVVYVSCDENVFEYEW